MMLRWVFLFLLLANAVSLLWYSGLQDSAQSVELEVQDPSVQTLRLVSELDQRLLAVATEPAPASNECLFFQGFSSEVSATAVVEFFAEQGFDANVDKDTQAVISDYSLNIAIPDELEKSMLLLDELESKGWQVSEDEFLTGGSIKVGQFTTRVEAEQVVQSFAEQKYSADIIANKHIETGYAVVVLQTAGRNLSKEIKEVVLESYSDIKIIKKVCSGVARDKRTE